MIGCSRDKPAFLVGALILLLGVLGGCSRSEPQPGVVEIENARVRATPPGIENSAAFMVLTSRGGDAAVVGARSDAATTVELHAHEKGEDGLMRMRRIPRIALPAERPVALSPGGLHIMLMGLRCQLEPGQTVHLVLVFEDGGELSVRAPVRAIAPARRGHGHPR